MTGGHSRADSFIESRGRTEGRSALPRRRATKMSYSETGGFDTDLALAVQESLRYARQAEREAKEREDGTISNHVGGERSCMMQSKFTDETTDECVMQSCAHLKDLLLVNLDLVQHQQEMLTEKEKEIRAVKSENNMLKCRLERMERRMAMLKQKEDSDFIMGTSVRSPANKSKPESENSTPAEKGVKRKGNIETESISKRLALADENDTPCTSSKSHPKHRKRSQLPTQEVSTASPTHTTRQKTTQIQEAIQPPTPRQKSWTITSDNSVSYRKKLLPILKDQKSDNVLRTNEPYFVSHFEPLDEDLSYRKDVVQTEDTQLEVKLPSWRPRKYPSLWVLEGTENLEDEVFVKRHQKLEVEEKRRKRWDLQRLREQKIYEKLKEKEMTAENLKKGEDQHVESFYPLLDDITHIEVCNKIPVMAFGHALPNLKSEEFDLPWEVDASKGHARSSRPGRSR
uniref:Male-specific lethal 1-like protein n=1 Tax=Magallana gigas TaxID=29159 RepID=K1QXD9_MAGGI|eukprot:XP_011425700.1 PREDICTED: male-specific lethal 1 homolog isoform X1 [Crassostrea gigas]